MTLRVLFAAPRRLWPEFEGPLNRAFARAGIAADLSPECDDPGAVDYIVYAPRGTITDFTPFVRTRAVLNLWAGVETIVGNPTLTQPLCRMVDPGLTQGMVEYVVGNVLRHHLGTDRYIRPAAPHWDVRIPPLASERKVAVLGLGVLGLAAARALVRLGFDVTGWARRARRVSGVRTRLGPAGLRATLSGAEIVVTLLPLTPATENTLDAESLGLLAQGAFIVNPGRGALIDEGALLAALGSGQVGGATLDVFRTEPLPPDHPFWADPRITITPHIAADTRAETSAEVIAENIRRDLDGRPLLHLVDRAAGY
ncbi:MAG: 2-hydroxyacid dehydrogenase [Gemmobacter sp.]